LTRSRSLTDFRMAKPRGSPVGQLCERHAVCDSSAHIENGTGFFRAAHLHQDERGEIPRVQTIPYLVAGTSEPNVFQRPLPFARVKPEAENALVCFPKLPCSGEDAASVYENRQIKGQAVFAADDFRCQFGTSIKRQWRLCGKLF